MGFKAQLLPLFVAGLVTGFVAGAASADNAGNVGGSLGGSTSGRGMTTPEHGGISDGAIDPRSIVSDAEAGNTGKVDHLGDRAAHPEEPRRLPRSDAPATDAKDLDGDRDHDVPPTARIR